MKKLRFLRPFRCDVLVFDTVGKNWIHQCIPPNCSVGYLSLRDELPIFLSFGFLFCLIKRLFRQDKTIVEISSFIWLSSLFDKINSKIILTCADNNVLISRYAKEKPELPVILVQNALRDTIGSISPGINLSWYMALGKIEAQIFDSIGIRCQEYRPIGSVKLGIALANYDPHDGPSYDMCFISHYRPELFSHDVAPLFRKIESHHRSLFRKVVDYAATQNLSLVILSRTRHTSMQITEKTYFSDIAGTVSFDFIRADKGANEFNTYFTGLSSDIIVHPASTLGFELFAAGKKVLFGASQDPDLVREWGIESYFNALPGIVKLETDSNDEFYQTCDFLRQMPTTLFQEKTQNAAKTIVSMPEEEYPHDIVQRLISDNLL